MIIVKAHMMPAILIYLSICGVIGLMGRRRKLGGWAYFFASICLTPLIGFLLISASDPRPRW
ncbi:MAG: hypothetical protein ACPGNV_12525 [Mangrovicoccus sp.]